MKNNAAAEKLHDSAIKIVNLYKYLLRDKKELILSKQMLRSDTAISSLIKEAEHTQSRSDFINKMNIVLKEADETEYWLTFLKDTAYFNENKDQSIKLNWTEAVKLLTNIVKKTKENDENRK